MYWRASRIHQQSNPNLQRHLLLSIIGVMRVFRSFLCLSRLREGTLTSLIYIVDKLEETQFQDRLVRVVCNMQNDVEAPIRTNATIFIGKIAVKMREGVR